MSLLPIKLKTLVKVKITTVAGVYIGCYGAYYATIALAQSGLPTLNAEALAQVLKTRTTPYALVARAGDVTLQRVDLVTLDPKTLHPLSRTQTAIQCARLHIAQDGTVLCLSNQHSGKGTDFGAPTALVYSPTLQPLHRYPADDFKSQINRARIANNGTAVAWTYFVRGHSYLDAGSAAFSTETRVSSDVKSGVSDNIQTWTLIHKGVKVSAIDLNYWGVTFDPRNTNRFFVTAHFKGKPYLAEGFLKEKRIQVIREGVECPSFSPDGTRIAYKKRTSSTRWSPAVLDLATQKETVFNKLAHSVDDQIEWLDAQTLMYKRSTAR